MVSNSVPFPRVPELDAATLTRTEVSTPGPERPDRRTGSEDTERLSETLPGGLPDISGYHLEAEIGAGGIGNVFRAVDLALDKTIALKVIYPRGRDKVRLLAMFDREVQLLAKLDHPNVVPIYHAGKWHGFPYFTMKLVPGGSLARHLDRFVGNASACARLIAKVARAIQFLHDNNVIHRDLKPLNILLGEGDEPLVADFGLAKWLGEPDPLDPTAVPLSFTGVPMGTKYYMSPEQTRGVTTDVPKACDTWAIGITLYELLAGRRPFTDGAGSIFDRIREDDPPPMPPEVPPELEAIAQKCLQKNPHDRFASAREVADHLEAWLAGKTPPRPLPEPKRPSKWPAALGLLTVLVLIALPAMLLPGPNREDKVAAGAQAQPGLPIALTNAKGRPLAPIIRPPGFDISELTDFKGDHAFSFQGMGEALLHDKPLELPVRISADVEFIAGLPDVPFAGLVVGGRSWNGERRGSYSFVRIGVTRNPDDGGLPPTLKCRAEVFWRPNGQPGGVSNDSLGAGVLIPLGAPGNLGSWKTTLVVDISADGLSPTVHGKVLPMLTGEWALDWLRGHANHPTIGRTDFNAPAFGNGIGVTVASTNAVFRNLTISTVPKP